MVFQSFCRLMVTPRSFKLTFFPSKKNQVINIRMSANNPLTTAHTPMKKTGDCRK